ncbi:MAG: alkaline phosphatase family protein [Anaerolineales bacterium]|nr:alkaline phosphatase family protein [Anaerolineales bacterium]
MHFLFLFMDGVGLGNPDPTINPFVKASLPNLTSLLNGQSFTAPTAPLVSRRATLHAWDATLGVRGLPQSASGQATLLTGKNVPALIGEHYGPKPNPPIAEILQGETVFTSLGGLGFSTALLGAYPPGYFEVIASGRRMFSAIPMAASNAGVRLMTKDDLFAGRALSAEFTGHGWREYLGLHDTPLLEHHTAGRLLASLAQSYDFSFFEYWLSDYAGHKQEMPQAVEMLESFDRVLGGLLDAWEDEQGLVLITSDHGNLEDLSTRKHTANPVPGLVIGAPDLRARFMAGVEDLSGVTPAIMRMFEPIG